METINLREKIKKFNKIELGDAFIYFVKRNKCKEPFMVEHKEPIFRADCTIHIGQILIQYDGDNIVNKDSVDIITEIEHIGGDGIPSYIIYIMDINDWIDSSLGEMIDTILKYGIDSYIEELKKLRDLGKQIEFVQNQKTKLMLWNNIGSLRKFTDNSKELKENLINDYFSV